MRCFILRHYLLLNALWEKPFYTNDLDDLKLKI